MVKNSVPDSQSLEISNLRKRWKIIFLQLISTAALLALMNRMTKIYGTAQNRSSRRIQMAQITGVRPMSTLAG